MQVRYRIPILLVAFMLVASSAFAQKPAVHFGPLPQPIGEYQIGQPISNNVVCELGVLGTPYWLLDFFLDSNDHYLTYINSANCPDCGSPGGVLLTTAHIFLYFQSTCPMDVAISVVGAQGDPGCREPNRNDVICPPVNYRLVPPSTGGFDIALPLTTACCLDGDAFLQFSVLSLNGCNTGSTRPLLVLQQEGCDPCISYNIYGAANTQLEFCNDIGLENPSHSVEVDCCGITGNRSSTWGRLKTLYRN